MLFHQIRGERGVDIEQLVCRTSERLDISSIRGALVTLLDWHPILRTQFQWESSESPFQETVPNAVPEVEELDRMQIPEPEIGTDFLRFLTQDRARGLNLADAPLIRASLLRYPGKDCLVLTLHHAIVDGRCFPILLEDFFRLYLCQENGTAAPEAPKRLDYCDFAAWLAKQDFETEAKPFWQNLLKNFTAPTPISVDRLPDAPDSSGQWQLESSLTREETTTLESLATSSGVTLNTIVQAAWSILLSRYSGETDVVFGGTRACRKSSLPEVEDAIGLFINTLPVRADADPDKPIKQLLSELREQWVAMRPHEHTPLAQIQSWSDLESGQQLFQSILVFERFDLGELMQQKGGDWANRTVELYEKTNFPITVAAYHGEALRIKIEFDNELFSSATIERMLGHLSELLRQFTANPNATIGSLEIVTETEKKILRSTWATPVDYRSDKTLVSWFEEQVEKKPDHIAMSFEDTSWTYRELNVEANRVAHYLLTEGNIEANPIVGLCVDRSPEIVVGILGILKAGAAYLPIDLAYPAERLQWMLEDSAAPVLLTQERLRNDLPDTKAEIVSLESLAESGWPENNPELEIDPDSLAYIIFTSGSTGKPKGCRVTHRNVVRLMDATYPWYGFNESDVWTLFHSFAFDFSVWEIWGALLYGGRVAVVPYDTTRSPFDFYQLLVDEGVTVLNQTPSAFRQLIEAERQLKGNPDKLSLRYVIFGGEALELESLRPWFERHGDEEPKLVNMYGITETTVHVTYRPISKDDLAGGSVIGCPIPDLEIHIQDPQGKAVPIGVPGEIFVGGAGVAAGYLNRPELTGERFLPHPWREGETLYRTGDVARYLPGGDLEYLGRCDDQVKIRGFRIELGEIQSVLVRHPAVREAFVTVSESRGDKQIVAYLVGNDGEIDLKELRAHAGESMPPYMVPSAMIFLDQFPLTNNGKIDRKALPDPSSSLREKSEARYVAPAGKMEEKLAAIWQAVLKLDRIGRDDNYFELGGDSILSIQIVSRARREEIELNPRDLFDHQTIAELAEAAEKRTPQLSSADDSAIEGVAPLTPIQNWFFSRDLPNPNHWNQAFLFELTQPLKPARVEAAVRKLVELHPALHSRYDVTGQEVTTPELSFVHSTDSEILTDCETAHKSLDIHSGRNLAAVYSTEGKTSLLFLAVHHLAVDGVSWRILLEDLEALLSGKTPEAPTTPFANWAHHLSALEKDEHFATHDDYWKGQALAFELPEKSVETSRAKDTKTFLISLDPEESSNLLTRVPGLVRARIDELLVAAVGRSLANWSQRGSVSIDLESHGRQENHRDYDLSRTVGWFTNIYPVTVNLSDSSPSADLKAVKETLRAVPGKGFSYSLRDRQLPKRDVLFNYLGQLDRVTGSTELFRFSDLDSGSWYDPEAERSHLLEINSWIKNGCLEFQWTYAGVTDEAIEKAALDCCETLRLFLSTTVKEASAHWVSSDFPLATLAEKDLTLLDESVEDVLSLTPLQHLYFTLESARPGSGIDQWHWKFVGDVNSEALCQAWNTVIQHHAGLRTRFTGQGSRSPIQIVTKSCSVEVEEIDWTNSHETNLEEFLKEDRYCGLPVEEAPLTRLTLIRLGEGENIFVWTHHHLQIDGWSWPIIVSQVSEAYQSILIGRTWNPPAGKSIRDYLKWSQSHDTSTSERFWKERLRGFTEPTPIPGNQSPAAVFAETSLTFDQERSEKLATLAKSLGCPLNTLIQAAWSLLLGKQACLDEIVFGASFSGRSPDLNGVETIVGTFVNNLPIRVSWDTDTKLSSLLKTIQEHGVSLAEHQTYPLSKIHLHSDIPLRQRLFETLLVFQNYSVDEKCIRWGSDLRIEEFTAPVRTNYPLTLVVEPGEELRFTLVRQTARFGEEYAALLLEQLSALLDSFAVDSDTEVPDLLKGIDLPVIERKSVEVDQRAQPGLPATSTMQRRIASVWEKAFGIENIGIDENFFDLGGHSLLLIQVHSLLCEELDRDIPVVDVFANPTIEKLADRLENPGREITPQTKGKKPSSTGHDIAIIGMSGRFPGAEDVDEFWKNLLANVESILDFTDEELRSEGFDPEAMRAAGNYVARRGQIPNPADFDAAFFDISPREASATDPQQRLFLETAWAALEDSGYAPSRFAERIGVFAGMSNNSYYEQYVSPDSDLRNSLGDLTVMMGNEKDYLATRTAYKLNLSGPALNIYTACSTSLVAVAEAVHALREGRCEIAIAGAVSLTFPQNRGYYYEEGGITSPDGHCRPFDEGANGTIFSNGMAAVILKPLEQALEDGDTVHAVIRGVGLNNDGADKVSFTAPSVEGQRDAILAAQHDAGASPESIGYIEGHGTGTTLGDPIEVEALSLAFRNGTDKTGICGLGSVKSNLGHLDAAAGMAGLFKATLSVREGIIPATLHTRRPNPKLRLHESPFTLVSANQKWNSTAGSPRRAGVSAFGVGGTNAHLIVEQPPASKPGSNSPRTSELLLLSAKTADALQQKCSDLANFLEANPDLNLADVAFTLATGREVFAFRHAFAAETGSDAVVSLRQLASQTPDTTRNTNLPVSFLFPGQGSQFGGMGKELYETEPAFREVFDHCSALLKEHLDMDLRDVVFSQTEESGKLLNQTKFTQPALFVTGYALGKLWQHYGVEPSRMIGHSVGEYAAACLAGVLPLDQALHLVAVRARLVDELPGGTMLSIRLPESEVEPLLIPGVEMAALNSPQMTVVAGSYEAIDRLEEKLTASEIPHRRLRTSHAFHSAMMEPVVEPFREAVEQVDISAPQIPYVSTLTGQQVDEATLSDPSYWSQHVRRPVRFETGIMTLAEEGATVLVETGPGRSALTFARQSISGGDHYPTVESLQKVADPQSFLETVGELWKAGGAIDWTKYFQGEKRRRISLPTYPFQRQRCWTNARSLVLPLQARQELPSATVTLESTPLVEPVAEPAPTVPVSTNITRKDNLVAELTHQFHALTGQDEASLKPDVSFLDLGVDSLLMGQAATILSRHFGEKITFRHLMDEHDSIGALAEYLDQALPKGKFEPIAQTVAPVPVSAPVTFSPDPVEARLSRIEDALNQIRPGILGGAPAAVSPLPDKSIYAAGTLHADGKSPISFGPFRPVEKAHDNGLTERQREHLADLIARYVAAYPKSKEHTQKHRAQLADPRAAAGFNQLWKDMVYPVVTDRSEGAYLWDVDGNKWIDVTHGFGLGLFGHRPKFVVDAVEKQLHTGFEIGPASPMAGEVAEMLCRISGKDRVTFCNTGSEAVTAAIRIARTASARNKVAVFQGSYHGIFDEVLGRPLVRNGMLVTMPIAPGIPEEHLENVLILDYGNPESLEFIEKYADDLAAVLVEPVQSRRPDLQPREFLRQLRDLTEKKDIALVFDEVVTGFRAHPRGSQGVFDIDADLVTYGKVLGGGMPIGALAGRKKYMDALDGGTWQYGDDSGPEASVTFFAGTFVRHPLVLAAARAVLQEIEKGEGKPQAELDARTEEMVGRMNEFCETAGVPIKVTRFSSMYFINFAPELKFASLFFYHMRLRGIHIWETRPSFLSLAHTAEDIDAIYNAFCESITELQDCGFFPEPPGKRTIRVTPEQQEVFLASSMSEANSRAFNESISIIFEGNIDVDRLRSAAEKLVVRHEALRLVFSPTGTEQRMIPADEFPIVWKNIDLVNENCPPNAKIEFIGAAFDLIEGPLVRFLHLRHSNLKHELVISAHHAICDGWSFGVLYEDLLDLYTHPKSTADAARYTDYLDLLEEPSSIAETTADTSFWVDQLLPVPPKLNLPADLAIGVKPPYSAETVTLDLSEQLCKSLNRFCKERKLTPYAVLFAAYSDILHRFSGQDDFCIGTPIAGQGLTGMQRLTGHAVRFLPLRCQTETETTLEEFLEGIRKTILDSLDHQQSTFSRIVEAMPEGQKLAPIPVTFTLETTSPTRVEGTWSAHIAVNPKLFHSFDVSLTAIENEKTYTLSAVFRSDRFESETVHSWLSLMEYWIQQALSADPSTRLCALFNPYTASKLTFPEPTSAAIEEICRNSDVASIFETQAVLHQNRIALKTDVSSVSYSHLNNVANQFAVYFSELGVLPGHRVVLECDRSIEFIVAVLGLLKLGAIYVPIDPNYPSERKTLLTKAAAAHLSVNGSLLSEWFSKCDADKKTSNPDRSLDGESPAYIMFTSGSTGEPKGVVVPHRAILRLVLEPDFMEIRETDVFILSAPTSFDASTLEIWGALLNGTSLAIPPAGVLTLDELASQIETHRVSILWLTAGLFHLMVDEKLGSLCKLRVLLAGGDVLNPTHVRKALENLPDTILINGYGPTENTTFTTCHRITEKDLNRPTIPIGRPISGTSVYILDSDGNSLPNGVAGELCTGGLGLALEYLGSKKATQEKFVIHPIGKTNELLYHTGDRCRILPNGSVEFLGRIDRQTKIRGFRVEPGEIERAIEDHPGISQCRVVIAGDTADDKRIVACCIGDPTIESALADSVKRKLPKALFPSEYRFFESFRLTPNGKIDVKALLSNIPSSTHNEASLAVMPETETERRMHEIWIQLLGRSDFGITDRFFDIGGHSLLGLRLFSKLKEEFGFTSPLAILFDHPTIQSLSIVVDRSSSRHHEPALNDQHLARLRTDGSSPPIFLVHGGDGGIVFFNPLVKELDGLRCPIYAIESPALMGERLPVTTLEDIIDRYVQIIRRAQPVGPYRIGGYSFGGVVAYELARRLEEDGERAQLILFDTSSPEAERQTRNSILGRARVTWQRNPEIAPFPRGLKVLKRISYGSLHKVAHWIRLALCEQKRVFGNLTKPEDRTFFLNELHYRTLAGYKPSGSIHSALLLRATEQSDRCNLPYDYGWHPGLIENLVIEEIETDHVNLFDKDVLPSVAIAIESYLNDSVIEPNGQKPKALPDKSQPEKIGETVDS